MIHLKNTSQIESMKKGGAMLKEALVYAQSQVRVGITTLELNNRIEQKILSLGGYPGFKKVKGYSWGTCICINDQVVHTPPSKRIIKDADVVTIDAGVFFEGLHTDSAVTVQAGTQTPAITRFLEVGKQALQSALEQTVVGNRIGHISSAFQDTIESAGYSIIRELTGHGVGAELHEDPYIPCFLEKKISQTKELVPGMTLALEVMYSMGKPKIATERDGWSIRVVDGSPTATFEHTVALSENGTLILT